MLLIPQETVQRLQGDQTDVSSLDKAMTTVLKNRKISDAVKWQQYNQILQRFLHVAGQKRKTLKIPLESSTSEQLKVAILGTVPIKYQRKAILLLDVLTNEERIQWTKNGEVTIKGQKIQGSNLVELINDVLRHRRNVEPIGWQEFALLLKDLNVGRDVIGNKDRYDFLNQTGSGFKWHSFRFGKQ